MEFNRSFSSRLKLSLTPLIDMVFLLVVFFMLTTTFSEHESITLNFADTTSESLATKDQKFIIVSVASKEVIRMGGKKFDYSIFPYVLKKLLVQNPNVKIILQAGKNVTVQNMISVIDGVHTAGIFDITFTEK